MTFASRNNYQFKPYCSFRPDPECQVVDSLTIIRQTLHIFTILLDSQSLTKDQDRGSNRSDSSPILEKAGVVSTTGENVNKKTCENINEKELAESAS